MEGSTITPEETDRIYETRTILALNDKASILKM